MHDGLTTSLPDLDLTGLPCLVVGHGFSASRRGSALRACGGIVTLVSCHGYRRGMAGAYQVVVTCDRRVDDLVVADAQAAGVLVHVVGDARRSTVALPRQALRQLVP
jgi:siroheme synthase (precorrin-2 oxidase/ferrochelatase)